jgi:hypothetical protein
MSAVAEAVDPNHLGMIRGAAAGAYMLAGQSAQQAFQNANRVEAALNLAATLTTLDPEALPIPAKSTEFVGTDETVIEGTRFSISPPKATLELARRIANVEKGSIRTSRTVVLIETKQGPTIVTGGASDLSPAQLALADKEGLTPAAPMPGIHGEGKGLFGPHAIYLEPTRGVSTNKVCQHCETEYILPLGGIVLPNRREFRF